MLQEADDVHDGTERVADLVRDGRGHAAEVGEAFGARHLLFEGLARGDILRDALHAGDRARLVAQGDVRLRAPRDARAVPVDHAELDGAHDVAPQHPR